MQTYKLYVGNLNYKVAPQDVEELFSNYGQVVSVKIVEGKGFGFVEFSNPEDSENAKTKLNGYEFKGRPLRVAEAHPQKERKEGGSFNPSRGPRRGPGPNSSFKRGNMRTPRRSFSSHSDESE